VPTRSSSNRNRPDGALLSVRWGMLWGIALGLWLLAPAVIDTHHLQPEVPGQWAVLLGALTVMFAVVGAVLGFIGGLGLSVIERLVGGTFHARPWAYALFSGIAVVVLYAADSFTIQWLTYGSFDFEPLVYRSVIVFGLSSVFALVVLVVLYRAITKRSVQPPPVILGRVLSAVAASGVLALVLPSSAASPSPAVVGALERLPSATEDVPLVLIALDGGSWRLLAPALEKGAAPTLRRLLERGMSGTVNALWPPYWSGAAWAAIVTGLPREATGVYEDLAASAPGLPLFQAPLRSALQLNPLYSIRSMLVARGIVSLTPPPRALLRAKPIWQLLHEAGVQTAVVRHRFTYPPRGQADIVVSDWVGYDHWERLRVRRRPTLAPVIPEEKADQLLAPFRPGGPSDPGLFTRLLPGPRPNKPPDVPLDPIRELEIASDIDDRTFDVSESIIRSHPKLPFLAVYFGGLDSVQHAFWQYRFPNDFPGASPARRDIDRLGQVPDEYVHYFDERLGRLLALYAREPDVLIVSDHGFGPTTIPSSWRGWHAQEGVFIAAGPSIPHSAKSVSVSYFDVVPTIARLKGFREPDVVHGRALVPDVSRD
jgi:hypothetical protein